MKALDFEYSGIRLSDLGFVICSFGGSSGTETIAGSEITFNTVSTQNGTINHLISSSYEDCLTATFQICKNLCNDTNEVVDLETQRDIMRWLNRKSYHKFKLIDDEWAGIYLEGSFNVSKIEIGGRCFGFELELITNAPFCHSEPVTLNLDAEAGEVLSIYNKSDDEGYVYPSSMIITIEEDGNLEITNHTEKRTTIISNCYAGEVITMNYPMISSSLGADRQTKIQNDFNWTFPRIASSFKDRLNKITVSLPCQIKITYTPSIKVGI